jgi:hypothetical protein
MRFVIIMQTRVKLARRVIRHVAEAVAFGIGEVPGENESERADCGHDGRHIQPMPHRRLNTAPDQSISANWAAASPENTV